MSSNSFFITKSFSLLLFSFFALLQMGCGQEDTVPLDFVRNMGSGWNLGNSLESHLDAGRMAGVNEAETYWGNPATTKAMIDEIYKAGFQTLRIPVTWYEHIDENGTIDPLWLARVKSVVDYAIDNDMYVIINCHHENWYVPAYDNQAAANTKLASVWTQISEYFKSYDNHLLFEGMNEPRLVGTPQEWTAGTEEAWNVINDLNQTFVDTVRKSGGKNETRYLLVPTYCASTEAEALANFRLPEGEHLIVSVHAYIPYTFAHQEDGSSEWDASNPADTKPVTDFMDNLSSSFIEKGIPVIIGEFGSIDKNNTESRTAWTRYYVDYAREKGLMYIWWDNGGDSVSTENTFRLFNRTSLTWDFPQIRDVLTQQ